MWTDNISSNAGFNLYGFLCMRPDQLTVTVSNFFTSCTCANSHYTSFICRFFNQTLTGQSPMTLSCLHPWTVPRESGTQHLDSACVLWMTVIPVVWQPVDFSLSTTTCWLYPLNQGVCWAPAKWSHFPSKMSCWKNMFDHLATSLVIIHVWSRGKHFHPTSFSIY